MDIDTQILFNSPCTLCHVHYVYHIRFLTVMLHRILAMVKIVFVHNLFVTNYKKWNGERFFGDEFVTKCRDEKQYSWGHYLRTWMMMSRFYNSTWRLTRKCTNRKPKTIWTSGISLRLVFFKFIRLCSKLIPSESKYIWMPLKW